MFCEAELIKLRLHAEIEYLLFLSHNGLLPKCTKAHSASLRALVTNFSDKTALAIKDIERTTKHDVKAVEYYLTSELVKLKSPLSSYVHLCLTSEDINSIAYGIQLQVGLQSVVLPALRAGLAQLRDLAAVSADAVMPARTHEQVAIPTTMGKELANFGVRLMEELQILENLPVSAKLTGAVGTFAAHQTTFPDADWLALSSAFCASLGLKPELFTTQIVPADSSARIFASLVRCNQILLDCSQDLWRYCGDGYFNQKIAPGQVGSSTMPHKSNPIDFENAEGNLGLATSLLQHLGTKLAVSRLQRDLSDSTVKRSIGTAIGYCVLAYQSFVRGLKTLEANPAVMTADLADSYEMLAEPIQVLLRLHGDVQGYQKLQQLAHGKKLSREDLQSWINQLNVEESLRTQLLELKPETYVGLAPQLTQLGIARVSEYLQGVS